MQSGKRHSGVFSLRAQQAIRTRIPNKPAYQPNIVFILTDQQRYDTIAAPGFGYIKTPHLDRFVNEGVSFERCYITARPCVPSRCSLFPGVLSAYNGCLQKWRYVDHELGELGEQPGGSRVPMRERR